MGLIKNFFKKDDKNSFDVIGVTINKEIKLAPGESLARTPEKAKRPKPSLDERWKSISNDIQIHLQEGRYGLYACDMYSLSEIDRKEKRYNDQLHKLMISAYIHISGVEEFNSFSMLRDSGIRNMETPLLPPAVIRSTDVVMKRLNMDIEEYKQIFVQTVKESMTPFHVYGVNGTLKIICLYLNDEPQKAEKELAAGAKKYAKTH